MNYNELTCEELEQLLYNSIDLNLLSFDAETQREEAENLRLGLKEELFLEVYEKELETIRDIEVNANKEVEKFNTLFELLYIKSFNENYFWEFCPYEVYKNTFEQRFKSYKSINFDADIDDFINLEYANISSTFYYHKNPFEEQIRLFLFKEGSFDLSYIDNYDKQTFSQRKKLLFLSKLDINNISQNQSEYIDDNYSFDSLNKIPKFDAYEIALLAKILNEKFKLHRDLEQYEICNGLADATGFSQSTVNQYIKDISTGIKYARQDKKESLKEKLLLIVNLLNDN